MTRHPTLLPSSGVTGHAVQLATPSSICLTGVMFSEGSLEVSRAIDKGTTEKSIAGTTTTTWKSSEERRLYGTIRYRIFRPRQIQMLPAPLVVIHGGPGVPSNYLMNLVNVVTDRTVIFYDQIGCGRSSRLTEKEAYSIESSVDDLRALLNHWKLKNFHIFGHSFGGIVAFEFLKQEQQQTTLTTNPECDGERVDTRKLDGIPCLSLILSSVPTDTKVVASESQRLLQNIRDTGCEDDQIAATFSFTHECRTIPTPLALLDAYAQAGSPLWRGISAIPLYKAVLETTTTTTNTDTVSPQLLDTPCCILRGQYDFVTERCVVGWDQLFVSAQSTVLAGCSHHGLLENEQLYGDVIGAFLEDQDL